MLFFLYLIYYKVGINVQTNNAIYNSYFTLHHSDNHKEKDQVFCRVPVVFYKMLISLKKFFLIDNFRPTTNMCRTMRR